MLKTFLTTSLSTTTSLIVSTAITTNMLAPLGASTQALMRGRSAIVAPVRSLYDRYFKSVATAASDPKMSTAVQSRAVGVGVVRNTTTVIASARTVMVAT
jgi:hypothetical protein